MSETPSTQFMCNKPNCVCNILRTQSTNLSAANLKVNIRA